MTVYCALGRAEGVECSFPFPDEVTSDEAVDEKPLLAASGGFC